MLWRKINGTESGECVRWIHNAVYMKHTWRAHGCSVMLTLQPWAVADLAPLCMFPKQGYWSGLPFSTPGDLLDTGIQPMSLVSPALTGGFFTTTSPGKPLFTYLFRNYFKLTGKKKKDTRNYCLMNLLEEVAITPEQLCPTQP